MPDYDTPDGMMTDDELLAKAQTEFSADVDHWQAWMTEAQECFDFRAGHQWDELDITKLKAEQRPAVTYNRVTPILEAVEGQQVNNRQEVRYIPREMGDVAVNEILTGAADWVRDNCDAEDEESDAFSDMLTCGIGNVQTRMDYTQDPAGEILIERIDPLEVLWDCTALKKNLVDAAHVFRVKDAPEDELRATFPEWDGSYNSTDPGWDMPWSVMRQPHRNIARDQYTAQQPGTFGQPGRGECRLVEYQWLEHETAVILANPMMPGGVEVVSEEQAQQLLAALVAQTGAQIAEDDLDVRMLPMYRGHQARKRVMRAFFVGNTVLERGPAPDPERFTYQCMTGKRDKTHNVWYGLVRAARDPQMWQNKFFSQMMHVVNTNTLGGTFYETGAFVSPSDAEARLAKPNAFIELTEGALTGGKVEQRRPADIPVSLVSLLDISLRALPETMGVPLEFLGRQERDQPGILEVERKQSAINVLAPMFDSLRRYRKVQGRVLLTFIQKYISDGRLIRITGQDGQQQYVQLAKQPETATYDVIIDDAPTSPNQKAQTFSVLRSLFPAQTFMMLPPEVQLMFLRYAPLPESLIQQLGQLMAQQTENPEAEQARRVAAQLQMQQAQADVEKTQSETVENLAQARNQQAQARARLAETPANIINKTMDRSRYN